MKTTVTKAIQSAKEGTEYVWIVPEGQEHADDIPIEDAKATTFDESMIVVKSWYEESQTAWKNGLRKPDCLCIVYKNVRRRR